MKKKLSCGIRETVGDRVFLIGAYAMCAVILLLVAYPLYFVLIASVSDPDAVNRGEVLFWPAKTSLQAYISVFQESQVWTGYRNTILYTCLLYTSCRQARNFCPLSVSSRLLPTRLKSMTPSSFSKRMICLDTADCETNIFLAVCETLSVSPTLTKYSSCDKVKPFPLFSREYVPCGFDTRPRFFFSIA